MDIHAVTAAVLLEKILGPSHGQSQDALVSADGTLKRADVSQPPNHTWHGPGTSNALSDLRTSASKVSAAACNDTMRMLGIEDSVAKKLKDKIHEHTIGCANKLMKSKRMLAFRSRGSRYDAYRCSLFLYRKNCV